MQFVEVPDFLVNATNVYRTDGYIVPACRKNSIFCEILQSMVWVKRS